LKSEELKRRTKEDELTAIFIASRKTARNKDKID
jgi:hypothetical protein